MRSRALMIGGRIDRYVTTLFLSSYATATFLVVGLFLVLDLAQNLDEYIKPFKDGSSKPWILIVRFYLLQVPFLFVQVAPFVMLVAGLFTVSKMQKHNETIAVLSAGVSARRLLAPIVVFAALAAAGMFQLREALSFELGSKRESLRYLLEAEENGYDQVYKQLFLKDLSGSVVRLAEFRPSTGNPPFAELRNLEAHVLSVSKWIEVKADRGVFVRRGDGTGWRLEGGVRKDEKGEVPIEMLEGFEFTPELALTFYRARTNPLELSWRETREMARRDPDNVVYQTLLQYLITFPLGNIVLVLVGLPLLMRYERRRGAASLASGCVLCILYFATDFVFRTRGLEAALDPKLAAWTPVLVFGSLGIVLYDSMRS
jgi:lipopolysaccharide export system permease protein